MFSTYFDCRKILTTHGRLDLVPAGKQMSSYKGYLYHTRRLKLKNQILRPYRMCQNIYRSKAVNTQYVIPHLTLPSAWSCMKIILFYQYIYTTNGLSIYFLWKVYVLYLYLLAFIKYDMSNVKTFSSTKRTIKLA